MLIRIIKELRDLPEYKRPMRGKVYETLDQISGRYNAQANCRKIIIVNSHKVSVHREEYEPTQKIRRRKSNEGG